MFLQEQGIKGGCGAKIIFPQFDTIILTYVYHFSGDEIG
jgi:hypothetical protein